MGFAWRNPHNAVPKETCSAIASEYLVKTLSSRVYEMAVETHTGYAATLSSNLGAHNPLSIRCTYVYNPLWCTHIALSMVHVHIQPPLSMVHVHNPHSLCTHNTHTPAGNNCYLKREDTQLVFSFKIRGAYNKIASLSKEQKAKGVVTCSAGNHAQGVAMSAAKLGINAIVVMPVATPKIKVNAVRRFGGTTVKVSTFPYKCILTFLYTINAY
jgi:rhodanese-related sulfurtransferase